MYFYFFYLKQCHFNCKVWYCLQSVNASIHCSFTFTTYIIIYLLSFFKKNRYIIHLCKTASTTHVFGGTGLLLVNVTWDMKAIVRYVQSKWANLVSQRGRWCLMSEISVWKINLIILTTITCQIFLKKIWTIYIINSHI